MVVAGQGALLALVVVVEHQVEVGAGLGVEVVGGQEDCQAKPQQVQVLCAAGPRTQQQQLKQQR
jgi:hypothetical protein